MAGKIINIGQQRLIRTFCDRLQNRFDVFMIIEGDRGLGKSTLAFKLMKGVKNEMKKRGVDGYKFSPRRDLLYTRKEIIRFFNDKKRAGIGDEFVLAGFSRDFYNEDQKDLIKIINTNRDKNHFFIACIPHFKNLDTQLKKLCSMRMTVVRRGLAIVQTPNKTIYSVDKWDEDINSKIERKWLEKGNIRPDYSKLTTFRGVLTFSKLSEKQEAIYQKIKDDKRMLIAQEKGQIEQTQEEEDPFMIIYNSLINKKVKNTAMLDGMGLAHGINPDTLKSKLRRKLVKDCKSTKITEYYYDGEPQVQQPKARKINSNTALIQKVKARMSAGTS